MTRNAPVSLESCLNYHCTACFFRSGVYTAGSVRHRRPVPGALDCHPLALHSREVRNSHVTICPYERSSTVTYLEAFVHDAGLSVKAMAEKESKRIDLKTEVRYTLAVPSLLSVCIILVCLSMLGRFRTNLQCHSMLGQFCKGAATVLERSAVAEQVPLYPESSVQVKLDSTEASDWQGDLLAIGLYEEDISSEGMSLPLSSPSCCLLLCPQQNGLTD